MNVQDLGPAARRMADLVRSVPDDALDRPTPCEEMSVGALVDHAGAFAQAFTTAARKQARLDSERPPRPDAAHLGDDWRARIPAAIEALGDSWRDPAAWTG